jgi:Rieske 2Fe-2S family protein
VRAPLRGEHVVLVRSADLGVAALHAVCTHRGTLLCDGESGRAADLRITCPYHGWTYATDGALLDAPGARGPAPGLCRARVESFAGVLFVSLDPAAPPLALPPWLERLRGTPLARARRTDHEVHANWKLVVGNFQESHHFTHVHPSLEAKTPWGASSSVIESDAWLGGTMELRNGFETVSESGTRCGRPFVASDEDRGRVLDALVFPLWLTSLQPDYLLTYRLAPLDVDRTRVTAEIHVHPAALAKGADLGDLFTFWDRTNAEDRAICELQQKGLSSSRARLRYAESEDGLHAFERLVAERLLRALAENA